MIYLTLLVTLLLSFCPLALASSTCETVNLYEQATNPINQIPIWDQAQFGTCFAYSASQLVDYELRTNGDPLQGTPVSPVWTALNHKKHASALQKLITFHDPDGLEYSSISWAIKDLKKNGVCKYDTVKKALGNFKIDHDITDDEFILLFSKLWKTTSKSNLNDVDQILEKLNEDKDFRKMTDDLMVRLSKNASPADPGAATDPVLTKNNFLKNYIAELKNKFIVKAETKSLLRYLKNVVFEECKDDNLVKVDLPPLVHFGEFYSTDRNVIRKLDHVFDQTVAKPIAIGYCAGVYHDQEINIDDRVTIAPRIIALPSKSGCSPHYSLLVGKRQSKDAESGSCDYLLRNSYGTHFWTKKYECYCEEQDGKRRNCSYDQDKDIPGIKVLGCWIKGEDLSASIFDGVYFR